MTVISGESVFNQVDGKAGQNAPEYGTYVVHVKKYVTIEELDEVVQTFPTGDTWVQAYLQKMYRRLGDK